MGRRYFPATALSVAAVAFVIPGLGGNAANAAAGAPFLAHQALYELSLVKSRQHLDRGRARAHPV